MSTETSSADLPAHVKSYARYLMMMAGLGGLIYGIDVGVIAAALPYIQATSNYSAAQISQVVAAVLAGSVISSIFAGILAEAFGRRAIVILSALLFTVSIPVICLSGGEFTAMMGGRILQGASGGLIGVVIPMYLAECLSAQDRGKGTGFFQLLLTIGLVFASLTGLIVATYVGAASDDAVSIDSKLWAWQLIFWVSIVPGIMLFFGAFRLKESPRWLYYRGRREEALASFAANNGDKVAAHLLDEMIANDNADKEKKAALKLASKGDTIFQRKFVIPFMLAVVILACNQATGINSVLNYSVTVLMQAGLDGEGSFANIADLAIKLVNAIMTVVAVSLVDKKGRKYLLKLGTSGIIVGLVGVGCMFYGVEKGRVDVTSQVSTLVKDGTSLNLKVDDIVKAAGRPEFMSGESVTPGMQLILTFEHGGAVKQTIAEFRAPKDASTKAITAATKAKTLEVKEEKFTAPNFIDKALFWITPPTEGTVKGLVITKAEIGQKPTQTRGWLVTGFFIIFISMYAVGPGVCVWLALSELMPDRIRANGMAIALLINQGVSTVIAGSFLPWVAADGYSTVFFCLAGFTVIYFITAAFFLPETKGRTLAEIEEYFTNGKMPDEKKS